MLFKPNALDLSFPKDSSVTSAKSLTIVTVSIWPALMINKTEEYTENTFNFQLLIYVFSRENKMSSSVHQNYLSLTHFNSQHKIILQQVLEQYCLSHIRLFSDTYYIFSVHLLKKWIVLLPLDIVQSLLFWMTNKTASLPDLIQVTRKKGNKLLLMEELHYTLGQRKTNENTVQRCMS